MAITPGTSVTGPALGAKYAPRKKHATVTLLGEDETELKLCVQEFSTVIAIKVLGILKKLHAVLGDFHASGGVLANPFTTDEDGELAFNPGAASDWLGILLSVLEQAGDEIPVVVGHALVKDHPGHDTLTRDEVGELSVDETIEILKAVYQVNLGNLLGKYLKRAIPTETPTASESVSETNSIPPSE